MNVLEPAVIGRLRELYRAGKTTRQAARELEISKCTVSTYYRRFFFADPVASPRCGCGRAVSHKGMCRHRLVSRGLYSRSLAEAA